MKSWSYLFPDRATKLLRLRKRQLFKVLINAHLLFSFPDIRRIDNQVELKQIEDCCANGVAFVCVFACSREESDKNSTEIIEEKGDQLL